MVFDPWKNGVAARKLQDLVVAKKLAKAWNTKLANNEDAYVPTTDDKSSVLDPIANALWNHSKKFTDELRDYADPYRVVISRKFERFGFSQGKYTFELRNDNGVLSSRQLLFELAYDLDDKFDGFYDIVDDMIFKWEEAVNDKKRDRALRTSVSAKRLNNLPLDKREQRFAERYIDMAKASGTGSFSIAKKHGDILCPDHGNPMMARKDDLDVLHCLVDGCTKVAKRKKKLEQPKSDQTIGQKLSAVLEGTSEAVLKFEGALDEGKFKGVSTEDFILDEMDRMATDTSISPSVIDLMADQYKKISANRFNFQLSHSPQTASTVGTKQAMQLGFQRNDNPIVFHHDPSTQRAYLIQKDQQTGQDIWIDITSAGGSYDIKTDIGGLYEITVTLHPRTNHYY